MWERLSNERCQRRIVTRGKRLKMSAVSVLSRPRQVGRTPDVLHDPVSFCHVHMSGPFRSTLWPGINHKMIMYIPSWPSVLICLEPHTRIAGPISKLEYSSIIIMIIFFCNFLKTSPWFINDIEIHFLMIFSSGDLNLLLIERCKT